ncbi:MAG: glycine betaine/choline ABC-type transport system substrate-binding protein [Glaciecola sp.]|jgi:glycine betaine/choline ABC-type transport system substrate-binding protein
MTAKKNKGILTRSAPYLLAIYCIAVLLFFLAELKLFGLDEHLRATNQVLILFALLMLPFVIINMPSFIQSLTLRISDKEFNIQLSNLESTLSESISKVQRQISTAEQSLWPMLADTDIKSKNRLMAAPPTLILGAKADPSQLFFTQLLACAIFHYTPIIKLDIRYPNGDSMRNFAELKYRWLDMYMDCTGTCIQYFNISQKTANGLVKEDSQIVEELNFYGNNLGIKWLSLLGASEDYCLVMTPESMQQHDIKSLADLKTKGHNLILSADPEFMNRKDCLLGLIEYGINFKEVLPCSVSDRYAGLETEEADVFVGYESDPQLMRNEVRQLEDLDQFFPRYLIVPIISREVLDCFDGLEDAIGLLENCMTTKELNDIVARIANANNDPERAKAEAQRIFDRAIKSKR